MCLFVWLVVRIGALCGQTSHAQLDAEMRSQSYARSTSTQRGCSRGISGRYRTRSPTSIVPSSRPLRLPTCIMPVSIVPCSRPHRQQPDEAFSPTVGPCVSAAADCEWLHAPSPRGHCAGARLRAAKPVRRRCDAARRAELAGQPPSRRACEYSPCPLRMRLYSTPHGTKPTRDLPPAAPVRSPSQGVPGADLTPRADHLCT